MHMHLPAWLSTHWPSQCQACHRWPAQPLCTDCMQRFASASRRCRTCALRLPDADSVDQCGQCLRQPPAVSHCLAAVDYGYPWTLLLQQWKFQATPGLSRHLAAWLEPSILQDFLAPCELTIPIPLSSQRLQERGYNQALLLARALLCPHLQPHLLERPRDTTAQTRQQRADRLRNLRGAFHVPTAAQPQLTGRHVLLVDDVITTGATMQAAAHTLLQAGAASVRALALARTP